jgi:integrase
MGSVTKSGKRWRAQVRVVGFPAAYKSFEKKAAAWSWVDTTERDLKTRKRGDYPKHTFKEALVKYRLEEAPKRKGARWEIVRCRKLERDPIADRLMTSLTDDDWAHWREGELHKNSPATVRREMGLVGQVFEAAREKWRWVPANVLRTVKRPKVPKKRLPPPLPQSTIDAMVKTLGMAHKSREVALGFLLGCETAMRPWEMQPLSKDQIAWRDCEARLENTKNGDDRDVPLSPAAIEILAELDAMNPGPTFFTVAQGSMTALWGEARNAAGFQGLHFRHSRREGIRRLSTRLNPWELCRAIGHRDPKSVMHYYQTTASEMAKKLATPSPLQPSSADAHPPKSIQEPESPAR